MDSQTDKNYVEPLTCKLSTYQTFGWCERRVEDELTKLRMMDKTQLGNHVQNKEQNHSQKKKIKTQNEESNLQIMKNEFKLSKYQRC